MYIVFVNVAIIDRDKKPSLNERPKYDNVHPLELAEYKASILIIILENTEYLRRTARNPFLL